MRLRRQPTLNTMRPERRIVAVRSSVPVYRTRVFIVGDSGRKRDGRRAFRRGLSSEASSVVFLDFCMRLRFVVVIRSVPKGQCYAVADFEGVVG